MNTSIPEEWHHIPCEVNPADFPSRGYDNKVLLESRLLRYPERLVRSMKQLLVRMLGKVLDAEELSIVLCDVEAVINGRPLTYTFEGDSLIILTPSHFINDTRSEGVPDIDHVHRTQFKRKYRYRQNLMERLS